MAKESSCQAGNTQVCSLVGKILWRRKWQPIPVFLPGKSHGQGSLVGYSSWGRKRVRHDLVHNYHTTTQNTVKAIR